MNTGVPVPSKNGIIMSKRGNEQMMTMATRVGVTLAFCLAVPGVSIADATTFVVKPGGKSILICPPDLAYGKGSPSPLIPPNSTLIFEVDLISIEK